MRSLSNVFWMSLVLCALSVAGVRAASRPAAACLQSRHSGATAPDGRAPAPRRHRRGQTASTAGNSGLSPHSRAPPYESATVPVRRCTLPPA